MQFFILLPAAFYKVRYQPAEFKFQIPPLYSIEIASQDSSSKECTQMLLFCKVWGKALLTFTFWKNHGYLTPACKKTDVNFQEDELAE